MLYGPEVFLSNIGSRDYVLELSVVFSQPASRRLLQEETLSSSFVAQRHYASGVWSLGDRDRMIDQWIDDTVRSLWPIHNASRKYSMLPPYRMGILNYRLG